MPVKIFFCYAHEDEQLLNKLKNHLSPLKRTGIIDIWHDRDISAGTDWDQQIKIHLNQAQIILLLVSPDFMFYDFCYGVELQQVIERQALGEARVIPIILRQVYWESLLGRLQALPADTRPVESWPDLDEALYNVSKSIRKAIEEITPKLSLPSSLSPTQPVLETPLRTKPPETIMKTYKEWIEEGNKLIGLEQYLDALAAYEQAICLNPNSAVAFSNISWALNKLKRYHEALAVSEHAMHLDPNYALPYFNKGNALFGLNRYKEALVAYKQAIRLKPNYTEAYNNSGVSLNKLKQYKKALAASEQALNLDPNLAAAHDTKGEALNGLKRYHESLASCEQAILLDPNSADAYQNKGNALNGLNRKEEAQQAYEKARQLGYSA